MSSIELEKMKIPKMKNIQFKFELHGEFNITSFIARQKVNRYLLLNTGNLIHSLEPNLVIGDSLQWKVALGYSIPGKGFLGKVGEIIVDAITGNLKLEISTPIKEIEANADSLYRKNTSQTRD